MQRILLAGGGHTHLAAAAALARRVGHWARVSLVSESAQLLYSGSMPGWLAGRHDLAHCGIDLIDLCQRSGIEWIEDRLVDIDFRARHALGQSGQCHGFDLISLNLGSANPAGTAQDAGREARSSVTVLPVKPFGHFVGAWQRWLAAAGPDPHCVVVGGGAAGFELACALRARFVGRSATLTLASDSPRLLATQGPLAGWLGARALRRLGITAQLRWRFEGVQGNEAIFSELTPHTPPGSQRGRERRVRADLVILATGAQPPEWLSRAARRDGLTVAPDGGIQVGPDLRTISSPEVWASGDCATFTGSRRVPKSGVHALKQGPVLAASIAAALTAAGAAAPGGAASSARYRPQRHALQLLDACDGSAIACWGPLAVSGASMWQWKQRIDERFLKAARGDPLASG